MRISLSFSLLLPFEPYIDLHAFNHTGTSMHGKIYIIAASQITQCFPRRSPWNRRRKRGAASSRLYKLMRTFDSSPPPFLSAPLPLLCQDDLHSFAVCTGTNIHGGVSEGRTTTRGWEGAWFSLFFREKGKVGNESQGKEKEERCRDKGIYSLCKLLLI